MAGVDFLHNVPLFANLSTTELGSLAQRLMARKYRSGELIFAQGSPGNSLYLVKSGLAAVIVGKGDDTRTVAQVGPGQAFGQFGLLDGLPRSAGVVARERSELLILTRPEFFIYLEQHPAVAINLLVLLSRRLRFSLQHTGPLDDSTSILVRLARVLADFGDRYGQPEGTNTQLSLRLTQGELAGIVGCTRSGIEQALEILRQKELVEVRGLHMTLHDLDGLRTVAAE